MGRDRLTDDGSPDLTDAMGLRDGVEAEIAEDLADHVGERHRSAPARRRARRHQDRAAGGR
jgi:hypothetical protein